MHSRIFQLGTSKIEKEEYITEGHYYESWFLGSVADYIKESDRGEDIEWLKSCFNSLGEYVTIDTEEGTVEFKEGFKTKYFERNFNKFKELSQAITIEEFSEQTYPTYSIKCLLSDKFSFYFEIEDGGLYCLDDFIRDVAEAGVKYHIGGTLDYHC